MNTQRSLLAMAVALGLTACGGGGGSSDSTDNSSSTSSYTARAADGYLEGAVACLDLNSNKACDDDEPSAVTDENGEFTLTGLTAAQRQNGVVVIEVVPGQTIDQDNPGVPLTKAYTLTAPPGSEFISPLTTLVQNEVEKGKSVEDAKAVVIAQLGDLGSKVDLEEDYVQAKATSTDYETLHKVAQVAASVMANATDSLDAAQGGIEEDELKELIIEQVGQVIEQVLTQIGHAGEEFDAEDIAELIGTELTQENLQDKLDELEAVKESEDVDLLKVLQSDGLAWFDSYQEDLLPSELEYGLVQVSDQHDVTEEQYTYNHETEAFERYVDEDDGQMLLSTSGWVPANDTVTAIVGNDDGSITIEKVVPELNEHISADRINISNLNVHEILEDGDEDGAWLDGIAADLAFPINSVAYQIEAEMVAEGYYSFNKGDWCEKDYPDRFATLGDMCNGISANKNGTDTWLTTLASTVASDASDRSGTRDTTDLIPMAGLPGGDVFAQLLENGQVVYYSVPWNGDSITKFAAVGSWQDVEANGQTLRELTLPSDIEDEITWSNFNRDDSKLYLAKYQDYIRVTWYVDADEAEGEELLFGLTAAEFIVDSYQPLNLQTCLDSLPDSGYEKQVGDTWVQNVTRDMEWTAQPQHWQYTLEHMGNNFSWLSDSNVEDLPAQLSSDSLTQTQVKGYDEQGSLVFVEAQYEDQDHYYGQIGRDESNNSWGNVKVVLPTPVAKSALALGKTVVHEDAAIASLTQVVDAAEGTLVEQLQSEYFTYSQQFLGKRSVEVAAGEFDTCHVVSYTHWGAGAGQQVTDTNVVWLNNRGVVKQERDDPSWGAKLSIEVESLPDVD
tara:strand:+ start:708 stop:3239 length:2532 start_codon:yes stop_codon:yes gene_type:complete